MKSKTCNTHATVHGNFHGPSCTTHVKVPGNFHVPSCTTHVKVHGNFHVPSCTTHLKVHGHFHVPSRTTVNFTTGSDFAVKFNFFFRNLANLTWFLIAPGKNFIEVADHCQKIGVLEYPICFWNVLVAAIP